MSTAAAIAALGFSAHGLADVLLGLLIFAAAWSRSSRSAVGCQIFGLLMRVGLDSGRGVRRVR